jgi:hypothetical protein
MGAHGWGVSQTNHCMFLEVSSFALRKIYRENIIVARHLRSVILEHRYTMHIYFFAISTVPTVFKLQIDFVCEVQILIKE